MTRATVSVAIGFPPGTEEEKNGPVDGADDNLEVLGKTGKTAPARAALLPTS
jgi:predicted ribonuclease YlaK